jgi:saccharopine dehydrogenase (NADP+, L-glutamate forming)
VIPKTILVLGAGRSATSLIAYLLDEAPRQDWQVCIADLDAKAAEAKTGGSPYGKSMAINSGHEAEVASAVRQADLVISLMPPPLHPRVARICVNEGRHLITASYVSKEMQAFDEEARQKGLLLLNECGLDPGIDHMSAMEVIHRIRSRGGALTSFESFTGGLIAPETDPGNPWRYKFTWNPRNVVMAGQGTARYMDEGELKFIPYQQLFRRITRVEVPGFGSFEGYANRDSLQYRDAYDLAHIPTLLRGTLRNEGFCRAWDIFVQLGCTDDSYEIEASHLTHREFINLFVGGKDASAVRAKVAAQLQLDPGGEELKRLDWSGLFSDELVGLASGSPARILEHILNKKWKLVPGDKDMIVMWHRFRYTEAGTQMEIQSSLTEVGIDQEHTAMARMVGLPLGIAAKLILQGKISQRGVALPVTREFYEPILKELLGLGIRFQEWERAFS